MDTTTIQVSKNFKEKLASHGRYGDSHEAILLRLLPKDFLESCTGDRSKVIYDAEDIDSKKTKQKRAVKTGSEDEE